MEQDNVRFVYQPLDELYIVLITNRQSNILQDIDSLHLFAQVTTSICKSLDEREILRNAFELLSAYDELVTLGYRENLSLTQIKTFLEMESHEERIQEIIERVCIPSPGYTVNGWLTLLGIEQRTRGQRGAQKEGQAAGDATERGRQIWPLYGSPGALLPRLYSPLPASCSRYLRHLRGGEEEVFR